MLENYVKMQIIYFYLWAKVKINSDNVLKDE